MSDFNYIYHDESIDPLTLRMAEKLPTDALPPSLRTRRPAPPSPHSTPLAIPPHHGGDEQTNPSHASMTGILRNTEVILQTRALESRTNVVKTEEIEPHIVSRFTLSPQ